MDFKFEIDDESCDTETGSIQFYNDTVDLLVSPNIYFDRVSISIGHKRVFDEDGQLESHTLCSVAITVSKDGHTYKFSTDRISFYDSFKVQRHLFNSMRDNALCGELTVITDFVNALRKFICDSCEQNDIAIFDK
jgi:hypothetical protein